MFTNKWFAHIQNDPYLKGTRELEGMVFHETISCLMEFVTSLQDKQSPIAIDKIDEHIGPFLKKLEHLKENSLAHEWLRTQLKDLNYQTLLKQKPFTDYTAGIVKSIHNLNSKDPNNSLLLAGGWKNTDGGHAMVYEFKKDEQGDLLFLVYNSGAGLNYHHKVQGIDKERFCPIYAYKIPKQSLQNERLPWFIGELLVPKLQLENESPYSAERLYQEIFPKIAYLKNSELVDPFPFTRPYNITAGQLSGTCAEKSLHQLLENEFPNKKTYQQFLYYFKKFALDKYFSNVEAESSFDDPGVLNQIHLAIENMSRLLLKADYFNESIRKNEANFLIPIKAKLNQYHENEQVSESKPAFELNINHSDLDKHKLLNLKYPKPAPPPELKWELNDKHPSTPSQPVHFNFQSKYLNKDLSLFKSQVENMFTADPKAALQSLESLFLEWPLPPNQLCKDLEERLKLIGSVKEQRNFILNLVSLNELYVQQYLRQHGSAIKPVFFVSQLSCIALISHLNDQAFGPQQSLLNIVAMALDKSLNKTLSNPALGSVDPGIDARFVQIKTALTPKYPPSRSDEHFLAASKSIKQFYDDVIKKHGLWDLFDKYYEKYAEVNQLSKNDRVNDYKEDDVRPLFLMKMYMESSELGKIQYIQDLSQYNHFNQEQREDLHQKLNEAEAEFVYQHRFETMIRGIWAPMRTNAMEQIKPNVIEFENRGYSGEPVSSPLVTALKHSELSTPKIWSLPENSIIEVLFKNYQLNENAIQVCEFLPKKLAKTKDIKWIREFLHLRSSTLMLPATIDFFGRHLNFLEDPQKQLYLEKNLFDPLLLIEALDKEPQIINQIHQFLEFGIQAFTKAGKLKPTALFFMKLEVTLSLYTIEYYGFKLKQSEHDNQEHKELHTKIHQLTDQLKVQLNRANRLFELNGDKPQHLHQLALQKNLILSFMMNNAASVKEKTALFQPFMSSLLAMRYYDRKSPIENLLEKEKLEQGFRVLQLSYDILVKENKAAAEQLLIHSFKDSISALSSDFKKLVQNNNLKFNIAMPFITLLNAQGEELLSVNLITGSILKPGLNKCYLPDDLKNKDWYLSLFNDYDPIARSNHDNTHYEFEHKDISYRIIKVGLDYVLQKQIKMFNQEPCWFQAETISKIEGLQSIFKEENSIAWIRAPFTDPENKSDAVEQVLVADKKSGKLHYCYQNQQLIQLDNKGLDTGYRVLDCGSSLHKLLAQFEDPQFIIVLKGPAGYQIELPRYSLKLAVKESISQENKAKSKWDIALAGTDYNLDLNEQALIPGLKAPLVFKSEKNKKLFLPIQQFIAEDDLKPKKKTSTSRVYAEGNTEPSFFDPSGPTLEDPSHRFDKKTKPTSDVEHEEQGPILENPSHRFDKKTKPTSDVEHEEQGPILENPSHRFDKKTKPTSDVEHEEQGPILENPSHRFDKKTKPKSDVKHEEQGPILENPSHRFDKKTKPKSDVKHEEQGPILGDPSHRFDKKGQPTPDAPTPSPAPAPTSRDLLAGSSTIGDSGLPNQFPEQVEEAKHGPTKTKIELQEPKLSPTGVQPEESKSPGTENESRSLEEKVPFTQKPKKKMSEHRSEYYNFIPNTGDYLRRDVVGRDALFNTYQGTETAAEYVVNDGQLLPKTMRDGLYLAYTYLCSHQTEKAYSTLDYCEHYFHELSGTDQELDILKWIIFSTPAKIKSSNIEAKIETPDFVAVKLKAMYLLASFKNHNPDFKVLDTEKAPPNSVDKLYQNKMFQERGLFYQHLHANIYALYHKYHHTQANLPKHLILKNAELLTLLRTVYGSKNRKATGPLGAQWRKLEAMDLQAEQKNLEEKARLYPQTIPEALLQEIKLTNMRSTKNKRVGIERTSLKESTIPIKISRQFDWKFQNLSVKDINGLNYLYAGNQDPIDQLLQFPIDETKFILNFPKLCDQIYNNNLNEHDRTQLLEFCEQTLKAHHKSSNINSNLPQLSHQLYVLIKHRDELKKLVSDKKSREEKAGRQFSFPYSSNMKNIDDWMQNLSKLLSELSIESKVLIKEPIDTNEGFLDDEKPLVRLDTISEHLKKTTKPFLPVPLESVNEEKSDPQEIKPVSSYQKEMTVLRDQFSVKNILCKELPALKTLFKDVTQLTQAYNHKIDALKKEYIKANTIAQYTARTKLTSELDNQAGSLTNQLDQDKAQSSLNAFEKYTTRQSISQKVSETEAQLKTLCSTKQKLLEDFANQNFIPNPNSPSQVDLQLKLLGRTLKKLKLTDLLQLYLNNDLNETMNATGLSETKAKELHNTITEYLAYSIQKQQFSRIGKIFKEFVDDKSDINNQSSLLTQQVLTKLGQALTEENVIPYGQSPALTLFQYDQDILVREVQKQFIESLLERNPETKEYSSKVIQLIMGGGKSKVLLPILALKKADGENLSIIEVPQALYRTNLADLNQISLRLFGQHAFGFNFNRQSACDSLTLKKLYRELKHTSATKGYVVTTKESMASLDLKYHELLSNPLKTEEWKKQIKWMDRVIKLRKTRGDLLIDEVDSNLFIRKQINYTIGDKSQVPLTHLNGVLGLYEFLNNIKYHDSNVLDLMLKTDSLSDLLLNQLLDHVANELVHNKQSPLYPFLTQPLSDAKHIQEYLLNKCKTYPKSVLEQKTKSGTFIFKFLKGELSHFLPHSLALKLYTNYGPSENPEKSALERLITIPYAGNNDPQERSKDTLHIKTLNLTLQSTLEQGLSAEILEFILADIINTAKRELLNDPKLGSMDNTSCGTAINTAFTKAGIQQLISKINLKDSDQILDLTKKLKKNRAFIFYTLQEYVFPKVQIDTKILVHTPLDHIDMYRTAQGVTGTPYNWRTLHNKIKFNELLSLGSDGLTISRLKQSTIDKESKEEHYETTVLVEQYDNPLQFIEDSVKKLPNPERFRAIIDIGARFRGVANKQVASVLTEYATQFNHTYNASIRYVLYFDKDPASQMDELFAIPVDNPKASPISLKGKTAKDIESLLQCTEDNYFTYYDQKHTVGSDIKQALSAHALVTVDRKTLKKDLCQGVMRMRGFGNGQKVSIVISQETCNAMSLDKDKININHIINLTDDNQQAMLLQDHYTAALQMMESCITNDLKSRILAIDDKDADKKAQLYHHFEDFFTQSISELFIDQYGAIEEEQSTETIFTNRIKKLIADWNTVLVNASCSPSPVELKTMEQHLEQIKTAALLNCDKAYLKAAQDQDQSSESQKEMHNQPEQDQNKDLEVDESFYEVHQNIATPLYWNSDATLNDFFNLRDDELFQTPYWDNKPVMAPKTIAMPRMLKNPKEWSEDKKMPYATSSFDETIRRSYNFMKTSHYDEEGRIADDQQKQVHSTLMIQKGTEFKCILLTFKEAQHVKKLLEKDKPEPPNYLWVTNTRDALYAGSMPDKAHLNNDYHRVMQQLKFYNGELNLLNLLDLSGTWLMEEVEEKLRYFEDHLLAFRMTDKQELNKLKKRTQSLHQAFQEVFNSLNKPFQDFDYKHRYPLISSTDIHHLGAFYAFCQALLSEPSALEQNEPFPAMFEEKRTNKGVLLDEFAEPFYFKLILNSKNDKLFIPYISLLSEEILQKRLVKAFELVEVSHDFSKIITLFDRVPFTNDAKKAVLLNALNQSLDKQSFIHNLLTHSSDEELKQLFHHLSIPLKQKLLQTLSSEQITQFMAKDLNLVKALCDDLVPYALNEKAPKLGTLGVIIPESKYEQKEYSYKYLLENTDKLKYIQTHASKDYLKNFWLPSGDTKPICEMFKLLCTNPDNKEYLSLFNEAYDLFRDSLEQVDEKLWLTSLGMCNTGSEFPLNPLVFLDDTLSLESYFNALKKEPDFFVGSCYQDTSHQIVNFFYHQLVKLNSDEQTAKLLNTDLVARRHPFSYKSLIDVLNTLEDKPKIFEPLLVLDIKGKLMVEAEKLTHQSFTTIGYVLTDYCSEFIKRPFDVTPLSQLRLYKEGSSKLIVDLIQEFGSDFDKESLKEALKNEQSVPTEAPKGYNPSFFKDVFSEDVSKISKKISPFN
jgi:hypothetical protein